MMKRTAHASLTIALTASICLFTLSSLAVAQTTDAKSPSSSADRAFLERASKAGVAEVAMGNLAKGNAASEDVKAFAAKMVDDHSAASAQLGAIAEQKGISPSEQPTTADAKEIQRLDSMSGKKFDAEYVKVQVKAHKDAVALFKKESVTGKDPDLKAFATETLPTLEDHLAMVTGLSKSMH